MVASNVYAVIENRKLSFIGTMNEIVRKYRVSKSTVFHGIYSSRKRNELFSYATVQANGNTITVFPWDERGY